MPPRLALYFNPLPSCEGRQDRQTALRRSSPFQSTPLMRGETLGTGWTFAEAIYFNPLPSCEGRQIVLDRRRGDDSISIHSPHARGDEKVQTFLGLDTDFNPLPSCEGRRDDTACRPKWTAFQSTPLMRGETVRFIRRHHPQTISIHSPHARGDASVKLQINRY